MIVCFESGTGRVMNLVFDPVPDGFLEFYQSTGQPAISVISEIPGADLCANYYVVDGEVLIPRPVIPAEVDKVVIAADDVDVATISGLPDPISITIDGEPYEIEGGVLEFATAMPATYRIEINKWPYMPWNLEIVAQ